VQGLTAGRWLAVSGTREIVASGNAPLRQLLARYAALGYTGIVQGICDGIDARAGRIARAIGQLAVHSVVPAGNDRRMARDWRVWSTSYERMPDGTTLTDRDRVVVDRAVALLAFPRYREDDYRSARSGTWYTIRYARAQGKLVEVVVLADLAGGRPR
jgi:hypothetical protein